MVRRSAPILLGLVVCLLFAVRPSGASSALRLDESRITVSLEEAQTRVSLEVESGEPRTFGARVTLALLDPRDKVRAEASSDVSLRPGKNPLSIPIKLTYSQLLEAERKQFPWYRLRYRIAPEGGPSVEVASAVEGFVSLSEVTPDLFELRVVTPRGARAGSRLQTRVRTFNPATGRPVKGVAVAGELKFDTEGDEPAVAKASAATGGDGFATLDFGVPRAAEDDGDLTVTARRGAFADSATGYVSVEQKTRVILATDKSLYQPGQTFHARALVFDAGDRALAGAKVTLKLEDPRDETAFSAETETSRYGIATADWPIPEGAKLGEYTLSIEMDDSRYETDESVKRAVRISRYDLPNFTVTAKPDRPYYLAGQNAEIEIRGDYLFGQPVKRGRVRLVRQTERRWDYEEQKYVTEEQDPVEGELDEQGRFVARVDFSEEHKELQGSGYSRYEDLAFAAYVTDATTNRTEQRRFRVRLTREPIHLYVNEGRYTQAKGLPLAMYVSASYADGTPAECEVEVIEEGQTFVTRVAGEPTREVKEPDKTILKVKTNRYGVAKIVGPTIGKDDPRSSVALSFVARDGGGRTGLHEENFWFKYYPRPGAPELRVETDKTIYRVGEPVNVEVTSDGDLTSAVVDVTAGGRSVYSKPVQLSGGRAVVVVPYDADFRGAVNVSVAGTDFYGADEDEFGVGSRTIVFPRDRELRLDVRMSRAKYQPGDDAVAQVALRTPAGRRAEGALGVVVFDRAVEERARVNEDYATAWGFADSVYGYLYDWQSVAGFTQRDIEKLDPARAVPAGLDEVAELLYNADRFDDDGRRVFGGTRFFRSHAQAFQELVVARLAPAREALKRRYDATAEYPTDADSLARMLSAAGVDFGSLRDPWGRPFRAEFHAEGPSAVLEITSDGMDKRAGTEDDFGASGFAWPYFRKVSEAIDRAVKAHHARTGGYVRDLQALAEELRREGVDLTNLRDPWGQRYAFEFGGEGKYYSITVRSSGPNKSFEQRGAEGSDDFTLSATLTDYFADTSAAVDAALARDLHDTSYFPGNEAELRAALRRRAIDFDSLRDAWGSRPYASFTARALYADRNAVEYRSGLGAADVQRTVIPVVQILQAVTLRSPGPDRQKGTADDFTLGSFASIASEQSGRDATPQPAQTPVTLSGGTGAITGTVTDPNGAVVPGAKVTAKHRFADITYTAESGEDGAYLLRNLPSGFYELTCEMQGFMLTVIRDVQVQSTNLTKVDITLNVAAAMETVEVTALPSAPVETTSSAVSQSVRVKYAGLAIMPLSTPRLREFFPETLVWQPAVETDRDGRAEVRFKLADNMTTWKMSVIASTEDGRVGTYDKEFVSSQPFFVEHDPPRVLTEGDRVSLPVVLRNYLERAQAVEVEMKPEAWFALEGPARLREQVPAGEAARPVFDFRAVASVKDGEQRVTALGPDASDAVEKPVTVHPDGEERAATDSALISDAGALSFNLPADAVRGSIHSELKLYPSLAAHLLEGVEAIMKRPYGCGEQTISSSYPSLLVLRYFEKDGEELDEAKLPPAGARALRYARQGYERLLRYRSPGGGFTYWGRGEPDLALTAYALCFLSDASRVVEVDEGVIKETRAWLLSKQRADGSWPAHVRGNDKEDARRTAITTAFVARVLAAARALETPGAPAQTQTARTRTPSQTPSSASTPQSAAAQKQDAPPPAPLERALRYLAARVSEMDEPYLVASYALASADAGDEEALALAAEKLVRLAHEEGDGSFWDLQTNTPFYGWGLAGRVETTALSLKALDAYCAKRPVGCSVEYGDTRRSARKLRESGLIFLLRNKDRYGVWYSTQATVNVHDALASLVKTGDKASGGVAEIFVNGRRAGALDLPPATQVTGPLTFDLMPFVSAGDNRVEVRRAAGSPLAQAQAVTTYYLPWAKALAGDEGVARGTTTQGGQTRAKSGDAGALLLSVAYDRTAAEINQAVTCSVTAERVGHSGYGMMLAEVGLPPGADVDRESLDKTVKESGWSINSYDILPDRVVLYLWPEGGGTKFSFKFRPRYGLEALTAPSTLYDYYNPEAHAVVAPTRFVVR
ncbi:MAG TPA: MG2 domain-containing protein [Pyrinomonadaceae bacterium]|nr:MG2 domain-containing protein [Pyrinomonadaceae bacterium]